jgi:hypothetical protein
MATNKRTRSQKHHSRHYHSFTQFKGKIVDRITAHITDYGCAIGVMFDDRTYLSFEVETGGVTILPDLSDWKTGNYKPLKRWRSLRG